MCNEAGLTTAFRVPHWRDGFADNSGFSSTSGHFDFIHGQLRRLQVKSITAADVMKAYA